MPKFVDAAVNGDLDYVARFARRNYSRQSYAAALMGACLNGRLDVVEYMFDIGADSTSDLRQLLILTEERKTKLIDNGEGYWNGCLGGVLQVLRYLHSVWVNRNASMVQDQDEDGYVDENDGGNSSQEMDADHVPDWRELLDTAIRNAREKWDYYINNSKDADELFRVGCELRPPIEELVMAVLDKNPSMVVLEKLKSLASSY